MAKRKVNMSKKKLTIIIIIAAAFCATVIGCSVSSKRKRAANSADFVVTDIAERGDIETVITGESTIEPFERYEIISAVGGDIISSAFDVGDMVTKGDVLYKFDSSDATLNIQKQQLNLNQSQNNLKNAKSDLNKAEEKLYIKAPNNGVVSGLNIKKGSMVNMKEDIAKVENTEELEVILPFTKEQTNSIYVGESAVVSSSEHMSSIDARVKSISDVATAQGDGSSTYNVTLSFENPGSITEGLTVSGSVGDNDSPGSGTVSYSESGMAKAESEGKIYQVYVSNGDYVKKGETIAVIDSENITTQKRTITGNELNLKNAEIAVKESKNALDDYSITSPISGTVITKNAKAGDKIDKTNASVPLMVVADISKLKFSLEIDELDVSKVKEGQKVEITCDAVPETEFEGVINNVSVEGTATNGVTTYSAEVVIDEPGELRPGMNIDASVIVDSVTDVVMVPNSDVKSAFGVKYVIAKDDGKVKAAKESDFKNASEKKPEKTVPDTEEKTKGNKNEKAEKKSIIPEAPEGFVVVIVKTGLSNDDYVEITSGLREGTIIQQMLTVADENSRSDDASEGMRQIGEMHSGGNMGGGMGRPGM